MSTTYKQVTTLEVKTKDTRENNQTFKINNPKTSGITLTMVKEAFAHVIDATTNNSGVQLIYSNDYYPITEVTEAQRKVVVTTVEDLPDE